MRLSNSGAYESPYGPASMNGRRNDLIFLCKSTLTADWPSSALGGNESFFFLEIYFRMIMGNMNFLTISIICNLVPNTNAIIFVFVVPINHLLFLVLVTP